MFEQSIAGSRRRPWTMAVSLSLQCTVVAAIVLWSILHIEALGPIRIPGPLPPFPRLAAVKIIDVQRSPATAASAVIPAARPVFAAPTRIASAAVALASIDEAPALGPPGAGAGMLDGVLSGVADLANKLSGGIVPALATRIEPPARTPPPPEKPRAIGGDVLEAKILNRVIPEYPPLARQARISGIVHLAGVIGRDGLVKSLQVIGGHPMLVKAALAAVQQWRYRPTLLNGEPVEVVAPITVNFTLR
jgi:protein TonB